MSDTNKIPRTPHWAIISNASIHHEGDERSRTNPGHGYEAYTETMMVYHPYADRDEWLLQIERMTKLGQRFVAIEAKPMTVTTTTTVAVSGG